ncbi:histidine phosphatase family protein [Deinococcus yavapaiensis]|uniref:Broad specificity phosphatase PhoE n=1 Tax=Deinococcus yavapaiensis KR-236 TaxID=694435 RepID=A0A318S7J2_9DEIO|nr:histidine phosphatase family protein [Deinococcus yavapaiensis]PYE51150.1 broad specificity phosphatase PhoE [Deinococcus yavapaiensis KR-236]
MRRLHLVRHAQTRQDSTVASHAWRLTDLGEQQAVELAERVATLSLSRVVTSEEPKAVRTGAVIARTLHLKAETRPGLAEHARTTAPYFDRPEDFHAAIRALFATPAERVFGEESANEAHDRFRAALTAFMAEREQDELVVTHGTVLSLLVTRANDLDSFDFWQRELAMPMLVTLTWPSLKLVSIFTPPRATRSAG